MTDTKQPSLADELERAFAIIKEAYAPPIEHNAAWVDFANLAYYNAPRIIAALRESGK